MTGVGEEWKQTTIFLAIAGVHLCPVFSFLLHHTQEPDFFSCDVTFWPSKDGGLSHTRDNLAGGTASACLNHACVLSLSISAFELIENVIETLFDT